MVRIAKRRKWLSLAFAIAISVTAGACSSSNSGSGSTGGSAAGSGSGTAMYMLPKFTGIPVFTQADQGAESMAAKWGYKLSYGGPTAASATQQVNFINTAVSDGSKGIFISADDPAAVTPALQRAQQHGVTVVSFDSDVLPQGRSLYIQGTSADLIANIELQMLGSQIGYSGKFVILSAQATDTNQVLWNRLLAQDLRTNPKYKNMQLVAIVNPPDDGTPSAVQYTQNILKQYPGIKGIVAPTTVAVAAAAQVIQQQHLCNKYVVTGLGDPLQMKSFVQSGCVKQFALWSFDREGQAAMCAMHALLSKEVTGKQGQSFSCPGLGTLQAGAQGTVTAGPPTVFSKANLSAFTF
jgi:rhamnose transport system substrate-binding protein